MKNQLRIFLLLMALVSYFQIEAQSDILNFNKIFYFNGVGAINDLLYFRIFKSNTVDPYLLQLIKNFNKKEVPIMPFKANFLMEKYNIPEGKELGGKLKLIEETWCDNNFQISDAEVQKIINN